MKPEDIREEFSPLLDGELPPEQREAVEARLAEDADLLRELEGLKRVDELYRKLPRENAPADFEQRVHEALRPKPVRLGRTRLAPRRLWPTLAAAMLLLTVGAGLVIMMQSPRRFDMASAPEVTRESADLAESPQAETSAEAEPVRSYGARRHGGPADEEAAPPTLGAAAPRPEPRAKSLAGAMAGDAVEAEAKPSTDGAWRGRALKSPVSVAESAPSGDTSGGMLKAPEPAPESLGAGAYTFEGGRAAGKPQGPVFEEVFEKEAADETDTGDAERVEEPTRMKAKAVRPPIQAQKVVPEETSPEAADAISEVAEDEGLSPAKEKKAVAALPPAALESPVLARKVPATVPDSKNSEAPVKGEAVSASPPPAPKKLFFGSEFGTQKKEMDASAGAAPKMAESPKAPAAPAPAAPMELGVPVEAKAETPKTVADRTFERRADTWVEKGYKDEKTTTLTRGTQAYKDFFSEHKKLRDIASLDGRVIFRNNKTWFVLVPPEKK